MFATTEPSHGSGMQSGARASFNPSLPQPRAGMCRQQVETPSYPIRGQGTTCPVPKHSLLSPKGKPKYGSALLGVWQHTLADQLMFTANNGKCQRCRAGADHRPRLKCLKIKLIYIPVFLARERQYVINLENTQ